MTTICTPTTSPGADRSLRRRTRLPVVAALTLVLIIGVLTLLLAPTAGDQTTTMSAGPGGSLTLPEPATGTDVAVRVGEQITIVLGAADWSFADANDPALTLVSRAVRPSTPCLRGESCGTSSATFDVVGPGRVIVSASRATCGEAIRCSVAQLEWKVTLTGFKTLRQKLST